MVAFLNNSLADGSFIGSKSLDFMSVGVPSVMNGTLMTEIIFGKFNRTAPNNIAIYQGAV
jgi:hypothetical protein